MDMFLELLRQALGEEGDAGRQDRGEHKDTELGKENKKPGREQGCVRRAQRGKQEDGLNEGGYIKGST